MIVFVIVMCVGVALLGGYAIGTAERGPKKPKDLPPPQPKAELNSSLPTKTDRWIMEQEHLLNETAQFEHKNCRVCGPGPLGRNEIPSVYDHVMRGEVVYGGMYGDYASEGVVSNINDANVVTSQIEGSEYHTLMLDLDDLPSRLLESSTSGHYHLYVDHPMKWKQYKKVLKALADAGVIEKAYYTESVRHRGSHLRVPWEDKA